MVIMYTSNLSGHHATPDSCGGEDRPRRAVNTDLDR